MTQTPSAMVGGCIDSRDITERLAELEADEARDADEDQELDELRVIDSEGSASIADWQYGETLIPECDFEDYARELADDIGAVKSDAGWPNSYIDWAAAADALKMDYSEVTIRGDAYLARSS